MSQKPGDGQVVSAVGVVLWDGALSPGGLHWPQRASELSWNVGKQLVPENELLCKKHLWYQEWSGNRPQTADSNPGLQRLLVQPPGPGFMALKGLWLPSPALSSESEVQATAPQPRLKPDGILWVCRLPAGRLSSESFRGYRASQADSQEPRNTLRGKTFVQLSAPACLEYQTYPRKNDGRTSLSREARGRSLTTSPKHLCPSPSPGTFSLQFKNLNSACNWKKKKRTKIRDFSFT